MSERAPGLRSKLENFFVHRSSKHCRQCILLLESARAPWSSWGRELVLVTCELVRIAA